jgi:hypothetical protein
VTLRPVPDQVLMWIGAFGIDLLKHGDERDQKVARIVIPYVAGKPVIRVIVSVERNA